MAIAGQLKQVERPVYEVKDDEDDGKHDSRRNVDHEGLAVLGRAPQRSMDDPPRPGRRVVMFGRRRHVVVIFDGPRRRLVRVVFVRRRHVRQRDHLLHIETT